MTSQNKGEIVHYGKNSISIFKDSLASIDKSYILIRRLDTRLIIPWSFDIILFFPNFLDATS